MAMKKPPGPPRAPEGGLDDLFADARTDRTEGRRAASRLDDAADDLAAAIVAVRSSPGDTLPLDARIEYSSPDGVAHTRVLLDSTTIGRHNDNAIQLLDPEVSKAHAVIRRSREGWVLEDLGSANGTTVNGIAQVRCRLHDGDVISVGNSVLTFRLEPRRRGAPPAAPRSSEPAAVSVPSPSTAPPARGIRPAAQVRPVRAGVAGPASSSTFSAPPRAQPLHSFAEMRKSDPLRRPPERPSEQTSVTLVPTDLLSDAGGDSVFDEQPAELDFQEVGRVSDERALRRDYERLRVAFDLFTNVGLETDLEALGQLILQKIRGVLPCDTAVIMLRDPTITAELVALASWSERGQAVNIPRAIVERVLTTKSGLLTSDAQVDKDLRRSETIVGARIRSALCVPLVVRDDVLGVIHLSSTSLAGAYEQKDLALLRAIAQPAGLAVANARLRRKIEEEAATRAELSRFLSPALVEKAVRNELDFGKAGDTVQATVLFSDIRGFTTISDGAAPEQVVSMLNEYFDAMVEVVFEHGGTLDKFIGDGLMAVWGTPVQSTDDAIRAVRAALAMRDALRDVVNAARLARGEAPLAVGYGIATGRVIAGAMGARRRLDFTVIGDTVNLASRLCGQARPGQLLVDETTERIIQRAGIPTTPLEPRTVKGFARPVPVFDVTGEVAADPIGDVAR